MIRTIEEISTELQRNVLKRDPLTYLGQGSLYGNLLTDIAKTIQSLESKLELTNKQRDVNTADMAGLKTIANNFQVPIESASKAYVLGTDKNIIISATNGQSVNQVLESNNISILGLRIQNKEKTTTYVVNNYLGSLDDAYIYVSAVALTPGTVNNVPKNTLTSFDGPYKNLKVRNKFGINTGLDGDTEQSLRIKIQNKLTAGMLNKEALSNLLTAMDVIGNFKIINDLTNPNAFIICVQSPTDIYAGTSYLNLISSKIKQYLPVDKTVIVRYFDQVGLSIKTKIVSKSNNGALLANNISAYITNYINSIIGGENLNLNDLAGNLQSRFTDLLLISRNNNSFEEVSVTSREGTFVNTEIIDPASMVLVKPTQIVTLENLIINYE